MDDKVIKVLLIEDNTDDAELLKRRLAKSRSGRFDVIPLTTLKEGLTLLARDGADIVLTDLGLPDSQGLDTITRILYQSKYTPVVVLSGLDDEELAIQAVHMGAQDYLVKGQMEGKQLEHALSYAIERSRLQRELEHYTQEIGKSRDNLRKILEKNADAIIIISQDRHMRFITPAAESLLRRRKKELIGKPFGFPLQAGEPTEIEIIHPGGETTVAEIRVVDIDWEGNPAYLASLHDITRRKKAEEALRFSDAAFRSINESVIATNPDYTITHWNEISEQIYGIRAAEAMGKKLLDVIEIAETQPGENAVRFSRLETNGSYQEEQLHRTKHGEVWVDVHIQAIEDTHKRYGWVILATAITQRKHAEEALRQSEEFNSSLLQNAPNPIVVINQDTSIKFANPAFEKLTSFTHAELIGRQAPFPWWPEETQEARHAALKEAMSGTSNLSERINRKKNGELFWAVISSVPVISGGKPRYLLVNWVDTTERKRTEEKMRESEEKYRLIFEQAADSIVLVDMNTLEILDFNDRAYENLGYTREEFSGFRLNDIDATIASEGAERRIQRLMEGGANIFETTHRTKSGGIRDVQVTSRAVHIGEKVLAMSIWHDITERKHAEEALRQSEEFSSSLMKSSAVPILVVNEDTSLRYVNPAFEGLTGFTSEEITGKQAPYPWWLKEARSGSLDELKRDVHTGVHGLEKLFLKKNGEQFWVEITSAPVQRDGKFQYSLENWLDITERKAAEEKLLQIDKLKSEFLSNVSHELRTPLQSIGGFTKLLLRGQVPDKETQQEFLEIIDRESQYLGNLINSLLDMSRLESGRFEINRRLAPIRETITDAVRIFKGMARDKEITLKEEIPEKLPEIEVDGGRLRQVVINLIGNAMKFSDPGGSITVKTECRNNELVFQVSDRGIGINEEAMKHLFERFYRAEDKLVRGGAGLGLYISKQIIEAHGGRIWAESKVGEGSTFSFALPLNGKGGKAHG